MSLLKHMAAGLAMLVSISAVFSQAAFARENAISVDMTDLNNDAWKHIAMANDDTVTTGAVIRKSARLDSAPSAYLYRGGAVKVIDKGEAWTEVESDGIHGYIRNEYLTYGTEAKGLAEYYGDYGVAASWNDVKVFAWDDPLAAIIGTANDGDTYPVVNNNGHWIEVDTGNNKTAYVSSEDVNLVIMLDGAVPADEGTKKAVQQTKADDAVYDNSQASYEEPSYAAASYAAPAQVEENYEDSSNQQNTYAETSYEAPSQQEVTYVETAQEAADYTEPSYKQAASADISYNEVSYQDASYTDSSYQETPYDDGSYQDASYTDGSYQETSYDGSSYQDASYTDTSYQETSYDGSSYQDASYADSSYQEVSYDNSSDQGAQAVEGVYDGSSYQEENYDNASYQDAGYDNISSQEAGYDNSSYQEAGYDNTYNQDTSYENASYEDASNQGASYEGYEQPSDQGTVYEAPAQQDVYEAPAQQDVYEAPAQQDVYEDAPAQVEEDNSSASVSQSDLDLLSALIYCEAGNQPYEGQVAVGAVVMNRIASGSFPDTISDVVYQSGQFTPAYSGALASALESGIGANYTEAAQAALAGDDPTSGSLYFNTSHGSGTQIGAHWFY